MNLNLADITWAWPWVFWLLPLPLLVYWLAPRHQRNQGRALLVPDLNRFGGLVSGATANKRRWFSVLVLSLLWCCLLLAAARPQSFDEPVGIPMTGRDLMLCIDISGSMSEQDLYVRDNVATRMSVVKYVAHDFVSRRKGDRIGLIMFGSAAYVQSPLTYDHTTVQHFLDEASVGLAGRSTAIGDAVGLAVKRLRDRPAESRVIILLTDGANSAGVVAPKEAAQLAADNNIRIHTIGVGSERRVNILGFATVDNELDEATLSEMASLTGGQYFRARDQKELENIYQEIDRLEPTEIDDIDFRPLKEWFFWPFSAAFLLSVLWGAGFVSTKRGRHG